jgi:two-component system sensor histidine kinase YesM
MPILRNRSIRTGIILTTTVITVLALAISLFSSFINFEITTTKLIEDSSVELNKQLIHNYENYIDSVTETANYISLTTNEYGLSGKMDELDLIYRQASDIQNDVVSIVLIDQYGQKVYSSREGRIKGDIVSKSWFDKALTTKEIFHFSSPKKQNIFVTNNDTDVITVSKAVNFYINDVKHEGVLVIDLSMENIENIASRADLGDSGHLLILSTDNSLIYSSDIFCSSTNCESVQLANNFVLGSDHVEVADVNMYLTINTLKNTRWRIATFVNSEDLYAARRNSRYVSFFVLIVTFAITILVATVLSKRITDPISELRSHINNIDKDNYKKINLEGQREVVDLADNFNEMVDDTLGLMNQLLDEQKAKRRSEFKALTTQINPHFLYNTLDSIMYLSENNENEKVNKMVAALSKFFRISISRGKNIIKLDEELEHAKNYLLIQQIRYNNKFTFEFDIAEDTNEFYVVKLILQPLIENAIYHGVNTEYDQGHIVIRSYIKDDNLMLEVEDDGYGIPEKKIEELYQAIKGSDSYASVGLKNVYQRLKIYFNDKSDLEIESELDEHTIFRLVLPIERRLK